MEGKEKMTKPNIIFILIDDLGWKDTSCMGSKFYDTPNIDRIANEGMLFTDAYAAAPVCSPTRASVMSGKYPARIGVTQYIGAQDHGYLAQVPYVNHLPLEEKTIATALKESGYTTWHLGKWHLGTEEYWPKHQGFDVNIGGCHLGHPRNGYFSPWRIDNLPEGKDGDYLTDRLGDEAVSLIENNDDTPFFMNMCFYSVHTPIQAKAEKIIKYKAKAKTMGLDKLKTFEEGDFFPCDHKKDLHITRRLVQSDATYAAMIESLDENVGKILDALDKKGVAENTMVIFTSDNGGLATAEGSPTCNFPLAEGKGWMYEGGTREPLLVRWPGKIKANSQCKAPVTTPDFYPTFLEAAGLPLMFEQHIDGVSMMPLFKGGDKLEREAIFWHYPHYSNQGGTPGCSMRMGDYKLIRFFEEDRYELYNLQEDISEQHDLSEQIPETLEKMKAILHNWTIEIGAKIPQHTLGFKPWSESHNKILKQTQ